MNSVKRLLTAFAAGAVAGATLGVLFAPEKGKDTRKKLDEEGRKLADKLKDTWQQGKAEWKQRNGNGEEETAETFI